jgi:hypothetical protein
MALVNFTNLDFDQIKGSIREYLRSNSNFTDYDFEGSNLSVIIDTLAYNTYITSYNANMMSNEVFIDSATLRENIVSLARNIGYVPRSRRASRANISFFVDTTNFSTNPISLTLKSGLVCTTNTSYSNQSYTFNIPKDITVPVVNGIAYFDNIDVYEGTYLTTTFTVDANQKNQRYILDNANIDTTLLNVSVRPTAQSTSQTKFNLATNLIDITSQSKIFFIQEIEDQRYELIFGDNIFGFALSNNNFIEISYLITNGIDANGTTGFTFNGRILDNNGSVIASGISLLTTNTSSQYGDEIESIESIKKYAPRIYASQNRAVTATDYETIITEIYPETESVSVFGGEDLSPPKYGRVYITIKPKNGSFLPNSVKDNLKRTLKKYSVAGIVPEILDLKYLYVEVNSGIYYNTNNAPNSNYVKTNIMNNVISYSKSTELNNYGAKFKYSKFLKIIDDSDKSITSNITKVSMRRDVSVELNKFAQYEICFGNEFHIKDSAGFNMKSSGFVVSGISGTQYLSDIPNSDLKTGKIFLFDGKNTNNKRFVGIVDYVNGEFKLSTINIVSTSKQKNNQPVIEFSISPRSNDVIGLQDLYLQLDINNSIFNMVSDEISSGSDTSGSNYIFTSSYTNGDLVRL